MKNQIEYRTVKFQEDEMLKINEQIQDRLKISVQSKQSQDSSIISRNEK